ncbi:rCG36420 [Rattus norvegicus]|uniref:RCG36420 n=1 Tax=Rattus norvegicus TaxID=10116 RepID=A6IQD6_RAT|nr:rCG36420 [Rattus norvegicus]
MATASERVPLLGQAPECRGTASRGAAQSPEPVARAAV